MFFFLKFKSQLRRTRYEIVQQLDEYITSSIINAGGKITGDRLIISAVFKEKSIGFWLNIYILIEEIRKNIEKSQEFFGFSLVITTKIPDSAEMLCRYLANHSGIFVNDIAAGKLIPYAKFEKPSEWLKGMKKRKYGCGSFYRIRELRVFRKIDKYEPDMEGIVLKVFEQEKENNILILEPPYSSVSGSLNNYCRKLNEDFLPFKVCFGSIGLGAIVDAWSPGIRAICGEKDTDEINKLSEQIFRERIRDEISEYTLRCVRRYLFLIIKCYLAAAQEKKRTPVIMLENVHLAGKNVAEILLDSIRGFNNENVFLIMGTGENNILPDKLRQWESVFKKIVKIENENQGKIHFPKLSNELWEIIYAILLLGRYFSPELFQKLFEENSINPAMIKKAFSILFNLGIIDSLHEPRTISALEEYARLTIDERCINVKELVRGRLLSWAAKRNINPCFRLLSIIAELDGKDQIDDLLLLKSISSDIINETTSGIENAIKTGLLEELTGERASAVKYIFETSKALHTGAGDFIENTGKEIENTFKLAETEGLNKSCDCYPVLKTQLLVNISAYYFGRHDNREAAAKAKEAILLGQEKNPFCLPQAFRIFSLVCLAKQQLLETMEYLGFAMSNAEKADNYHELATSAYYAAAVQFLYGDIYNSAKLARKSTEQSLSAGRSEWADRSRFLEGRIEFEIGQYLKAQEIFESILKNPFGSRTDEKDTLLAAWIYRCKIYSVDPENPKPNLVNHDTDLFEIEAAYLSGDYQKVVDLSISLTNPYKIQNFIFSEQAEWKSGFSQCEHLYFTNGEIQDRMIKAYHSLAVSRLSKQGKGREEALMEIQTILRDEKLCEIDPNDAFYFYAKYCILKETGADTVDLSTAVSMAFKRLQRRAGRIEDVETCRQYLNTPHWNRELMLAAKEFKLI